MAACAAALGTPASAQAAEVVASAPDEVRVVKGQISTFDLDVSAEGVIDCTTSPSSPATATFDTLYSVVGGKPEPSSPSRPLPFWASNLVLIPPAGCAVTGGPYRLTVSVAAAPDTAPGRYPLKILARSLDNRSTLLYGLQDSTAEETTVVVEDPPALIPPNALPPPFENLSINLLPIRGLVRVRYPGTSASIRITTPIQVPPRTGVNVDAGRVTLVSDAVGTGVPQVASLTDGAFRVDYTRDRPASPPITDLTLTGTVGPCPRGRGARVAARKRSRGLWARGKGRFRTRGRYGAGIVRGTHWRTENRCDGTYFRVRSGRVQVLDFAFRRTFNLFAGDSYLAQPPDPRRGRSRD